MEIFFLESTQKLLLYSTTKVCNKYTESYYGNAYYTETLRPNYLNFGLNKQKILANFCRLKVKICENMANKFKKKIDFFCDFLHELRL